MKGVLSFSGLPKILGSAKVGKILKSSIPNFTPVATLKYQWLRDGKPIVKAVGATYKVTAADKRHSLSVRLTASKDGYMPVLLTTMRTNRVG